MFTGPEMLQELARLNFSHVIWIPDSDLGRWERDLEGSTSVQLVRVCREGEAWLVAAGLILGGKTPLVIMQTTGLFESGNALCNVAHDLQLPVFALIGARSWLLPDSQDSARRFAVPILAAWNIEYVTIESRLQQARFAQHYEHCRAQHAGYRPHGRMKQMDRNEYDDDTEA